MPHRGSREQRGLDQKGEFWSRVAREFESHIGTRIQINETVFANVEICIAFLLNNR